MKRIILATVAALVVIVSAEDAEKARGAFEAQGEKVFTIGTVAKLPEGEAPCVVR